MTHLLEKITLGPPHTTQVGITDTQRKQQGGPWQMVCKDSPGSEVFENES